jgi:hypothetical protein
MPPCWRLNLQFWAKKIVAAETAMEDRQRQLLADGVHQNPAIHEEITAISGAISSLNILRRELKADRA